MWAATVETDCLITVVALNVEVVREIIVDDKINHSISTSDLGTMLRAAAVLMVDSKKLVGRFAATNALTAVVIDN